MMKHPLLLMLLLTVVLSCSAPVRRPPAALPETDAETRTLLLRLAGANSKLKTFKAVAAVNLFNPAAAQRNTRVRAVLAGQNDQKIRVEVLGVTGGPMASLAYDGRRLYFLSHQESRIYKKRETNPDLRSIVSLPVRVGDVLDLMAGRAPIDPDASVAVMPLYDRTDMRHLVLRPNPYANGTDHLRIDAVDVVLRRLERFDGNDALVFAVELHQYRTVDGYKIPGRLLFSGQNGVRVEMTLVRYWANAAVNADLFRLAAPAGFSWQEQDNGRR